MNGKKKIIIIEIKDNFLQQDGLLWLIGSTGYEPHALKRLVYHFLRWVVLHCDDVVMVDD